MKSIKKTKPHPREKLNCFLSSVKFPKDLLGKSEKGRDAPRNKSSKTV